MVRCLLGVLFVAAGLVALASTNRKIPPHQEKPTPNSGPRLREIEAVNVSGVSRTLFRPLPALDLSFSLN